MEKETIELVRKMIEDGNLTQEVAEKYCPELKEDKDEKLRKRLIQIFKSYQNPKIHINPNKWEGLKICDIIDWLEKQKVIDVLDEEEREFADNVDSYRKEVDAAYQRGYNEGVKATIEKQGEQKPTDKQGEQEYMKTCAEYYNQDNEWKMPELSEFQNKLADILMHREYDGPDETEDDIAKGRLEYELAAIRLSEELLPLAQKEQSAPNQEWSKEDERLFQIVIDILDRQNHLGNISRTDLIACVRKLKSLRPQNKTYYWTENEIKFAISDYIGGAESYEKMIEKLRRLKPQSIWKPSEEQMKALTFACIKNVGIDKSSIKALYDLKEQLKKLREE